MVKLCAPAVVLATLIWSTYQHALPYQVEDSSGYRYDDRIDAKRASGMDERQISARFARSKPRPIPGPGAAAGSVAHSQPASKAKALYDRAIHGSAEKFRPLLDSIFRMVSVGSAEEIEQATDTISAKLDAIAAQKGWDRLLERDEEPAAEIAEQASANWESSSSFEFEIGIALDPKEEQSDAADQEVFIDPIYTQDQISSQEKKVLARESLENEAYRAVAAMLELHQLREEEHANGGGLEKRGPLCH